MTRPLRWLADAWFPFALLALALLALPGLILVVLVLLGKDGPINEWLQANFQLSYALALPPWWALGLLLLPLVLLVLYFLKLKRKPVQVPSTYLWKKSIEDLHVNSLFQWLRNNVLLLLQILVILFLIYSVLGLRFHGSTSQGRHYVLMIDNSASMSAIDVAPNRLAWAKAEALKEIDAAGDDDFGMVIAFNAKATTLQTYTNNRARLREAVTDIEPTQRVTRIEEALSLAESLANPMRSTEDAASQPDNVPAGAERTFVPVRGMTAAVHLYSDGRFAKLSEGVLANLNSRLAGNVSALGNLNLHYHAAGKLSNGDANNVGIVALNALRYGTSRAKGHDARKLLVTVGVQNFRKEPVTVKLKLDVSVDGAQVFPTQQVVALPGRKIAPAEGDEDEKDEPGSATIAFQDLPALDPTKNIVLQVALDRVNDAFPLDDRAWLVLGTARKAKVLIVGPPNAILDAVFDQEATRRIAATERLTPAELDTDAYRQRARAGDVDLVIFDRCAPTREADMPLASTVFIDRPPPPWQRGTALLAQPLFMPSKQTHPLLRYLTTLWDVRVAEAFAFDLEANLDEKARAQLKLPEGDPQRRTLPTLTRLVETRGRVAGTPRSQIPLVFTLSRGAYTDLVLTFPLLNERGELMTSWPLQMSFPLFFRNVLYTLANVDDAARAVTVQPGEPMVLRPEAGVAELTVTPPGGAALKLQRGKRPDFVFADTDRVGVYSYQPEPTDGPPRRFAVNLLDAGESNIEPRAELRIGSERIAAGQERPQPREIWKWILLLAVFLLVVEWMVYNRRISV